MSLFARVKNLLLQPRAEWRRIDEEPAGIGRTMVRALLPLAAVPAVCSALGLCLVGIRGGGITVRLPWTVGALQALSLYLLAVIGLSVVAIVTAMVAPTFGGRAEATRSFKLVVHGAAAALAGGFFLLVPPLAPLALLAALYSAYLVFTGIPIVMRCAPKRSVPYTAVVVLAGAVVGVLGNSAMTHFLFAGLGGAEVAMHTPGGLLRLDATSLATASQQMADAAQRMASASDQQDAALQKQQGVQTGKVAPAVDSDKGVVPAAALKAALPETLGPFGRRSIEMQGGRVGDREASNARADYASGDQRLRVELTDLGHMRRLMADTGAVVQGERENAVESERTWQEGGRILHENYRKDGSFAQFTTTLRNGVVAELTGQRMTLDDVKAASSQLDLNLLENLRRSTTPP
ncbi:Yip1 family protein [Xylophilus sp. GOD-11R]|uniref:Yip1 family protein n=1 Tax=Xylophilus sp. GOD-11R TaxID=3089814 RepID=UPI00298CE61F|nr:Yip1 family protein [Xylophilus sp. GOD-11R]WPB57530.1 Yip1 family protein [Xylophilus sp. GOD-11R]